MARRKTLDAWIQEALLDTDKTGPCTAIVLVVMIGGTAQVPGAQRQELHTCRLDKGGKVLSAKEYADLLRGKAQAYAQDLPGTQTFQLMAFYEGSSEPQAFQPFMEGNNSEPGSRGLLTEPATAEGAKGQQMRWAEGLLSQVYQRQAVMDNHSMSMIQRMGEMIEKLTDDNHQAFQVVKEMIMEKVSSDREHELKVMAFQRATGERKKWLSFAPALVNTVLGREVFPQSVEDTALVETIADSISEEEMMKIGSVLKPEIMGPLANRFLKFQEKKNKEQELAEHAVKRLNPHPDPEADAGGD